MVEWAPLKAGSTAGGIMCFQSGCRGGCLLHTDARLHWQPCSRRRGSAAVRASSTPLAFREQSNHALSRQDTAQ